MLWVTELPYSTSGLSLSHSQCVCGCVPTHVSRKGCVLTYMCVICFDRSCSSLSFYRRQKDKIPIEYVPSLCPEYTLLLNLDQKKKKALLIILSPLLICHFQNVWHIRSLVLLKGLCPTQEKRGCFLVQMAAAG